uniref:Ig-like domain-containing protein n=1 Tax=Leptobrachium leishanense TaxID=445787 RepID=A0A8C5QWH7_9ANUR
MRSLFFLFCEYMMIPKIDFYPVDIAIVWLRDGEILRNSSMGKIQRNKNGTYSVGNKVTITPEHESKNQTFACRVRHESLPWEIFLLNSRIT